MHLARVRNHRHAVRLAQRVDLVRHRDPADAVRVVLHDRHGLAVEQLLEAVQREFVLAAGDRDARQPVQLRVAVEVVRDHRFFQPARLVFLELRQDALRIFEGPAHVALEHQVVVVADHLADRRDRFQVLDHALLPVRGPVAEAHLERAEAFLQVLLRFLLHRLQVGAIELRVVAGNLFLGAAAEQLEDRLADALAEDVPDRDVDRRDRRHADALAAPGMGRAVHPLVQVLVVPRVLADHERREVLVDDGLRDLRRERDVAEADDAVVGSDFDDRPRMEAERAHRFLRRIQQVHRVRTEVALRRDGLAFPLEYASAYGADLHDGVSRIGVVVCRRRASVTPKRRRCGARRPSGTRSAAPARSRRRRPCRGPRCRTRCRARAS
ncbi:Uncharacterised protein [Clostridium sporogenes]|nr:Uncharacterised protein [Clostridium sporogenes]